MTTQTEAQRLADALTRRVPVFDGAPIIDKAAAELRRLEAANAEMVEALKTMKFHVVELCSATGTPLPEASIDKCNAAIKKHGGAA